MIDSDALLAVGLKDQVVFWQVSTLPVPMFLVSPSQDYRWTASTKRTKNPGRLPVIFSTSIRSTGFVVDAVTINVAG